MRRTASIPALTTAALALVLAGCSADASGSPSDEPTTELAAFFEDIGSSYQGEDYERRQREVEEHVAACMAEQGFEYTPADPMSMADTSDLPSFDSKEFVDQYGYGATTMDEVYGTGEEWVDPNADYVAAMSESEQTAYYEALWGASPEVDPDDPDAEVEYNWEEAGCQGEAQQTVFSDQTLWDDPALEDFFDEMQSAYEDMNEDDPGLRETVGAWRECLADAGYDFATPDEAQQSIYDEVNALWEQTAPAEGEADPDASVEPDEAAMADLREKEMALAPADFACRESSGWMKAYKKANREIEERLWEKWGAQLEAAVAKKTPSE